MKQVNFTKGEARSIYLELASNTTGSVITPVSTSFTLSQDGVTLAGYPKPMSEIGASGTVWTCSYSLDTSVLAQGIYRADMQVTVTTSDGITRTFIETLDIVVKAQ